MDSKNPSSFDFVTKLLLPALALAGVVTPGCPTCRKRLFTMQNLMDHFADDVLPGLVDKLLTEMKA